MRVMSFNLRNARSDDGENRWELRRDAVIALIRKQRPDLLGTQEGYRDQLDELMAGLPEYGEIGVGREDGRREGEHSQILFRKERFRVEEDGAFWFSATPEVPGSMSWGNRITRLCTWARLEDLPSGRTLTLYNLHLDHESQPSREESARLLLERIRGRGHGGPVVVTGDFNAEEDNPAIRLLVERRDPALQDTFRALHPQARETATFHGFHGFRGGTRGERIDFIFASADLRVRDAGISQGMRNGRYVSDHHSVYAELVFA
jgi:endonuclease/exonuclease/phosphatase family metal-dependent hydrolase